LGYKEGAVDGHKRSMQEGFNDGFRCGVNESVHWGILIGKANAMQSYYRTNQELVQAIGKLLEEIQDIKRSHRTTETTQTRQHHDTIRDILLADDINIDDIVKMDTQLNNLIISHKSYTTGSK
jgi:flagellar biosynthesis/type III secretory pathway protein FliH